MKRLLSIILSVVLIVSSLVIINTNASAATFSDINQSSVFVKQQTNYTCTLASAVMMVRRASMMAGKSNWASVTESSMRSTAWVENSGLRWSFTYNGISVGHGTLSGGSGNKSTLISLLASHPEGIVAYNGGNSNQWHAILLTDYTNGTFYCADPAGNTSGRVALSSSTISGSGQDGKLANFNAYWYVTSPKVSLSDPSVNSPWINVTTYGIITGESNSFTFGANNATSYDITIKHNGTVIKNDKNVSSGVTYTFTEAGSYTAYITAKDGTNSVNSSEAAFYVIEPLDFGSYFVAKLKNPVSGCYVSAGSLGSNDSYPNVYLASETSNNNNEWKFIRQEDRSYKIVNVKTGYCLDVYNALPYDGTNIACYDDNGTDAQRWYIKKNMSGYAISPKIKPTADLSIIGNGLIYGECIFDGANIGIYGNDSVQSQRFEFEYTVPSVNAWIKIDKTILTSKEKLKFDFGSSYAKEYTLHVEYMEKDITETPINPGDAISFDESGKYTAHVIYTLEDGIKIKTDTVSFYNMKIHDLGASFKTKIRNTTSGFYLASEPNNNVFIASEKLSENNVWQFDKQEDGSYKITNIETGLVLDLFEGKVEDKTNIFCNIDNNSDTQRWFITTNNSGYAFAPKNDYTRYLSVFDNDTIWWYGEKTDGANIVLYDLDNVESQRFEFVDLEIITQPIEPTEPTSEESSSSETEPTEPLPEEPSSSQTEPTEPSSEEPSSSETEPTQPSSEEPSSSETEPTQPSVEEPSSSETEPTQPSVEEPSDPIVPSDPSEPSSEEPSSSETEPTQPSSEEPSSSETEPTQPSSEEPSSSETEPTQPSNEEPSSSETEPTQPSSEEPSSSETESTACEHIIVLANAKMATYEEDGYTGDNVCVKCGVVLEKGKVIPKLTVATQTPTTQKPADKPAQPTVCVHTTVVKNSKSATYFADGYSGDTVCVKCGKTTAKGSVVAKLTLKTPKFKLKKGKKQFKVKYTAVSGATGFQVRYKLKGKWKIKTYSSTKTVTKAIKKLKKGKYQVKLRTFVEQSGKKVYSAWSKTKRVKVK